MEAVREMHLRMQQEMQQILDDHERLRIDSVISKHSAQNECSQPCCKGGEYLRLKQVEAELLEQTGQLKEQLRRLQHEKQEQDEKLQVCAL